MFIIIRIVSMLALMVNVVVATEQTSPICSDSTNSRCPPSLAKAKGGKVPTRNLRLRAMRPEDLTGISLTELLQIRPKTPKSWIGRKFAYLFSKHPEVMEIDAYLPDSDAIAKHWCSLRVQKVNNGMKARDLRRLTASIGIHLGETLQADANMIERVDAAWTNEMHRIQNRRRIDRRGKIESNVEVRAYWRQKAREAKRKLKDGSHVSFEDLIDKYGVEVEGLDAAQIERKTRVFYKEMKPENTQVSKMSQYLKEKGFDNVDINTAIGSRRNFMTKQRSLKLQRRKRQKQREERINAEWPDKDENTAERHFKKLIGRSNWWE